MSGRHRNEGHDDPFGSDPYRPRPADDMIRSSAPNPVPGGRPPGPWGTPPPQPAATASGAWQSGRRRRRELFRPLAGAVVLVVLLGVGVYTFASNLGCSGETVTYQVAAAPAVAPAVTAAAGRFNEQHNEVGGHCVRAEVKAVDPAAVSTLLSGRGVSPGVGGRPDMWVPDSTVWTTLVNGSEEGSGILKVTGTSVALSPVVVSVARPVAAEPASASPSWGGLLKSAGALPGGTPRARLQVPDPSKNATGMNQLLITQALLAGQPKGTDLFAGAARAVREGLGSDVKAQLAALGRKQGGRYPMVIASEQAVWRHNQGRPAVPATALYPTEGTMSLDFPFAVVGGGSDKVETARLLEGALKTESTRRDVRALGLRSSGGEAPATFGAATGVRKEQPKRLPAPAPKTVVDLMQAWYRLSLSSRMLSLIDVSGSMLEKVPGSDMNRMQAIARVSTAGLALQPDDTELGQWQFSTNMDGRRDWKQTVSLGPLGERVGSTTRRQQILSSLARIRPKPDGDTALFVTLLAAFRHMKSTHKPEMINTILLLTDGKNDDPDGPTLAQTLAAFKKEYDPKRPVQIIMIGFGPGVDRAELQQLADVTKGSVYVAQTVQDIVKIFQTSMARRICAPDC